MRTGLELLRSAATSLRDEDRPLWLEIHRYLDAVDGTYRYSSAPGLGLRSTARIAKLNPDELAVIESALSDLLDGLEKGRALYGPLDLATNERDFLREAREEQRDGMLYTAMESVKQGRSK